MMGRKCPPRDSRSCHRVERTTSPAADSRLRELPPPGPHSRFLGKGRAEPAPGREKAGSERDRGFQCPPGWSAPPLLLATSGVDFHAAVLISSTAKVEIAGPVGRAPWLVEQAIRTTPWSNLSESPPWVSAEIAVHHPLRRLPRPTFAEHRYVTSLRPADSVLATH